MSAVLRETGAEQFDDTPSGSNWQWTVDRYQLAVDAGLIGRDERLELMQGRLIPMAPITPNHGGAVDLLTTRLIRHLDPTLYQVRGQNCIDFGPTSQPQPDIAVVVKDNYLHRHPKPGEVLLLIEVAMSSVAYDRGLKRKLYAEHGIGEYWVIDVRQASFNAWVSHTPRDGEYTVDGPVDGRVLTPRFARDIAIDLDALSGES